MTGSGKESGRPRSGRWTGPAGTPYPVDVRPDRRSRSLLALLVAGPVVWLAHFMLVYLAAEAACTGTGRGLDLLDPPVVEIVTVAATAVAAAVCAAFAVAAYRRWRGASPGAGTVRSLALAGMLLALLSMVSVLFVGIPVMVVPTC